MYLDHFGLTEAPFRITPHTDFFFEGANRGATLEALLYAITHDEGIVKVSGEVGTGKTMLCRVLIERLPKNVETVFLASPSLSRDEILFMLADELNINLATHRASAILRTLQEHLIELYSQGRQVVVLIDEAHAMPRETLEEIRLLSNLESNRHKLLQIVLFGQPELNDNLARQEMRQLKERITHNFNLEPLIHSDVAAYISFRMRAAGYKGPDVFAAPALKLIARASLGLTRRINIICDKALLAAFAGNTHQVTAAHVKAAVRDAEFGDIQSSRLHGRITAWIGAAAVVGLLVGGAIAYLWRTNEVETHSAKANVSSSPALAPTSSTLPVSLPPTSASVALPTAPTSAAAALPQTIATPPNIASSVPLSIVPISIAPNNSPTAEFDAKLGPLTRENVEKARPWLATADNNRWFIQLIKTDISKAGQVERFLARNTKPSDSPVLRAYLIKLSGAPRLGVIYGDYPSQEAATQAMATLPSNLKSYGAYPRQVQRLRP